MIRYTLKCTDGHSFESWFQSSEAFDSLMASGHLACAVCGSTGVEKAVMAPVVRARGERFPDKAAAPEPAAPQAGAPEAGALSRPLSPAEQAVRALRARVESTAENVGRGFAAEARRIHSGESEERAIYGEASGAEAKALIEDKIPVLPLPWGNRKAN